MYYLKMSYRKIGLLMGMSHRRACLTGGFVSLEDILYSSMCYIVKHILCQDWLFISCRRVWYFCPIHSGASVLVW